MKEKIGRRLFLEKAVAAAIAESLLPRTGRATSRPSELGAARYEIAAYYFGNYHVDPRNEKAHGPGRTEWNLVKSATLSGPSSTEGAALGVWR